MPPTMVKSVAIVSDTHGFLDNRIADRIKQCDIAVHAGDIGGANVIARMLPRLNIVVAVRGNNDITSKWPADHTNFLNTLKDEASLQLPGGELVVIHGHKQNPVAARHTLLRQRYAAARVVVYGHSHKLVVDQETTPWIINPGAAGKARTYGGPSCVILHTRHNHWHLETVRFSD